MKKIIMLLIFCSLLMTACSSNDITYTYSGQTDNWYIIYTIDGTAEDHDSYYKFKYIGNEETIKEVNYEISSIKEGESGAFTLPDTNEYSAGMIMTGGFYKTELEDLKILVKVEWNDLKEALILKKDK